MVGLILNHVKMVSVQNNSIVTGVLTVTTFILALIIFLVEFISMIRISDSTVHTVLMSLGLLLLLFFSPDMGSFFSMIDFSYSLQTFEMLGQFSFILTMVSALYFFRYTYHPKEKKIVIFPLLCIALICGMGYLIFFYSPYRILFHLICVLTGIIYFIIMQIQSYKANIDNATFLFTAVLLFSCMGMWTVNALYYTGFVSGSIGWSFGYIFLGVLCFIGVYVAFYIRTDRAAYRANEYKLQVECLKTKLLIEQIKPHFVFNALMTVKSMYHRDISAGDKTLEIFSKYLWESINMIDTEMISFEREVENISRFLDFINANLTQKFHIIYDIEETEFLVPPFSLQPFVENAVKYSRVNEKEDGYIMVSSYLDKTNRIILKISDNGVGFHPEEVKTSAHGIYNAKERFKLLANAEVCVESSASGTTIIISIPQHEREVQS